ncbi:hypothetical protein B0H15DRAFT_855579 [Mycena belliarum]|uniref:Uncharacterized protein n=1 Tax=Mycena belliarum TaxID=1033014 RepID=A0AAD6XMT4_9AGAR|nr:hypothetical protein B0H15DRAFT_855579 [Mycena belliae]
MNHAGRSAKNVVKIRRRTDGGVVGNWSRVPLVMRVSTFDATRLRPTDFIDIPRSANLFVEVFGHDPRTYRQFPWAKFSFRSADTPYTRPDTRLRGFFHYHVPISDRPLSGGVHFRLSTSPMGFVHGADLLCPTGLPWIVPLAHLQGLGGRPVMQSLLRDNLVSLSDIIACRTAINRRSHPDIPVVHAIGQPWYLDLRKPTHICVPGPHGLLRCHVYPAVALYGSALVCFESAANPAHPHELVIRVLERRDKIVFHPSFSHLPPLLPGSLLAHPMREPARTWKWNYDLVDTAKGGDGRRTLLHHQRARNRPQALGPLAPEPATLHALRDPNKR